MNNEFIIKTIFELLKPLRPYIYHKSKSNSIYIKFKNASVGSIRIGDHNERKRYSYRWNLRHDIKQKNIVDKHQHLQYYYPINLVFKMCQHIMNYENKMLIKKGNQT